MEKGCSNAIFSSELDYWRDSEKEKGNRGEKEDIWKGDFGVEEKRDWWVKERKEKDCDTIFFSDQSLSSACETSLVLWWEHLMSLPFLSETNLTILIDVTWTREIADNFFQTNFDQKPDVPF